MQNHQTQINEFKIRKLLLSDYDCLKKLIRELKLPNIPFGFYKNSHNNYFFKWFKLVLSNKMVGFLGLQGDNLEAEIISIGIKEKFQNLGGAKLLIKNVMNMGIKSIYLDVASNNEKAIKLYKSLGFKILQTRKNYYFSHSCIKLKMNSIIMYYNKFNKKVTY